jgi:hypothetical protein
MAAPRMNESTVVEPECGQLRARFSPAARQRVEAFLSSFSSFDPTLALLYGTEGGAQPGSWSMQAIGESMVNDLARRYAGFGAVVCYDLDGIRVVVPQLAHIRQLDHGKLDLQGARLTSVGAGAA